MIRGRCLSPAAAYSHLGLLIQSAITAGCSGDATSAPSETGTASYPLKYAERWVKKSAMNRKCWHAASKGSKGHPTQDTRWPQFGSHPWRPGLQLLLARQQCLLPYILPTNPDQPNTMLLSPEVCPPQPLAVQAQRQRGVCLETALVKLVKHHCGHTPQLRVLQQPPCSTV